MAKNLYQKWLDEIVEKAEKARNKALEDTYEEYFKVVEKKLRQIFIDIVDEYYMDYTPSFYEREGNIYSHKGGLYELLKIEVKKDHLRIEFDETVLEYRSGYNEEDGLYNTVFRLGYHGGANITGESDSYYIPYVKIPKSIKNQDIKYYLRYNGEIKPWDDKKPYGWKEAHQSDSLLEKWKCEVDECNKKYFIEEFNKIWEKNKAKINDYMKGV